jgi:hypothetical protein
MYECQYCKQPFKKFFNKRRHEELHDRLQESIFKSNRRLEEEPSNDSGEDSQVSSDYDESSQSSEGSVEETHPEDEILNNDSVQLLKSHILQAESGNIDITKNKLLDLILDLQPGDYEGREELKEDPGYYPDDGDIRLRNDVLEFLRSQIRAHIKGIHPLSKNILRNIVENIEADYETEPEEECVEDSD